LIKCGVNNIYNVPTIYTLIQHSANSMYNKWTEIITLLFIETKVTRQAIV